MNRNASFSNGTRVPTQQWWKVGDTVRLTTDARRKLGKLTLDVRDNDTAHVVDFCLVLDDVIILDRELAGSKVWTRGELARVSSAKEVKHTELTTKFSKSLLPAQRRNIGRLGVRSNLDFGFTPAQAMALDELETALADNEHPCIGGDRRRQCRARVVAAHQAVVKLGLLDALTLKERDTTLALFLNNTVL